MLPKRLLMIFGSKFRIPNWQVCFIGALLTIICGVQAEKEAIASMPISIACLYMGALAMGSALGANPICPMIMVTAGSLTAFLTPMATPAVPMAMGMGGYDVKSLFKQGWLISLILVVGYVLYSATVLPAF